MSTFPKNLLVTTILERNTSQSINQSFYCFHRLVYKSSAENQVVLTPLFMFWDILIPLNLAQLALSPHEVRTFIDISEVPKTPRIIVFYVHFDSMFTD